MTQQGRLSIMIPSSQNESLVLGEIVRAVVQGKLPISALAEAGITLDVQQDEPGGDRRIKVRLRNPLNIELRPVDIALGLLEYKDQPGKLQEWGSFVLCASEIIDLKQLESWPERDELLSALWDASFEGRVQDTSFRVASALAAE
jgi:hypothetical protein